MTDSQNTATNELLRQQIEQFTNFSTDLVGGGSVKKIMADVSAKSADLWQVAPEEIVVLPGYNPRVHNTAYYEGIAALGEGMAKNGYMQDKPLAVYIAKIDGHDRLVLQDGHRRHAGVMYAKATLGAPIKSVPIVVKPKSANSVDLLKEMLHANEATPFSMYEKAVIAKRFKGYGWTDKQIAEEMRCTTAFVGQLLNLAGAPQAIQQLVETGQMAATAAMDIVATHGEAAVEVAQEAVKRAKAAGKTKATMKDVPSAADQKAKNAKKVAFDMYKLLVKLSKDEALMKKMDAKCMEEMDRCIGIVETLRKPKEPKAPKAAKTPKAPKAIKVKPAKKTAAKKTSAKVAPWDRSKANGEARA